LCCKTVTRGARVSLQFLSKFAKTVSETRGPNPGKEKKAKTRHGQWRIESSLAGKTSSFRNQRKIAAQENHSTVTANRIG
jgi:hypothetical protein